MSKYINTLSIIVATGNPNLPVNCTVYRPNADLNPVPLGLCLTYRCHDCVFSHAKSTEGIVSAIQILRESN